MKTTHLSPSITTTSGRKRFEIHRSINLNIEEDDTLVIMPNIALTKSGALNASSKKRLAESGLTHHVRGETW